MDIAKQYDANIERDILAGVIAPSKKDVIHIGKAPKEEIPDLVKQLRHQKLKASEKKAGDTIGSIVEAEDEEKACALAGEKRR